MIKTFKKLKFILPIYVLFFIFISISGIIQVDYRLIAPAFNDDISETIFIPSMYETEGSFHTTSVISLDRITYLQLLIGRNLNKVEIDERPVYYDNFTPGDLRVRSSLMKNDSIQTSLIVGVSRTDTPITYTSYPTVYLTYRHMTEDSLLVGDYVLNVNGNTNIMEEVSTVECHEFADFEIIRNGETMIVSASKNEVDDQCSFGLMIDVFSEITESNVAYRIYDNNTGGPSGGLLQSLYIFNQLTEFDYTNGLKIGGTGTIDVEGNVGYIGGIREKIITSISNDIDIFFVPYLADTENDNYIAALAALSEFNSDMIIVGVKTIDEAIAYLESYGDTHE